MKVTFLLLVLCLVFAIVYSVTPTGALGAGIGCFICMYLDWMFSFNS